VKEVLNEGFVQTQRALGKKREFGKSVRMSKELKKVVQDAKEDELVRCGKELQKKTL